MPSLIARYRFNPPRDHWRRPEVGVQLAEPDLSALDHQTRVHFVAVPQRPDRVVNLKACVDVEAVQVDDPYVR